MNFYFVFEGKTEPIVYKNWINCLLPDLIEIESFDTASNNCYYYESDMGIPDCYNVVSDAIQDINTAGNYDYLILFIDADRLSVEDRKQEALEGIKFNLRHKQYKVLPENCKLEIIVQKVCIETWFLGNKSFFVRNPQHNETLRQYINYYDVSLNNPEDLAIEFTQNADNTNDIFGYKTKALFHEGYLREIFKERNVATNNAFPCYRKGNLHSVKEEYYLTQIIRRIEENPNHLLTFQNFLTFIDSIK